MLCSPETVGMVECGAFIRALRDVYWSGMARLTAGNSTGNDKPFGWSLVILGALWMVAVDSWCWDPGSGFHLHWKRGRGEGSWGVWGGGGLLLHPQEGSRRLKRRQRSDLHRVGGCLGRLALALVWCAHLLWRLLEDVELRTTGTGRLFAQRSKSTAGAVDGHTEKRSARHPRGLLVGRRQGFIIKRSTG